jgi:hypothetical protein
MDNKTRSAINRFCSIANLSAIIATLLLLSLSALTRPAQAAPLAQAIDLCALLPPGGRYAKGQLFGPTCDGTYPGNDFDDFNIQLLPSLQLVKTLISGSDGTFVNDIGDDGKEKTSGSYYTIIISRGCYVFGGSGKNAQAIRAAAKQIDDALLTMPPCGGGVLPTLASPPPASSGAFNTSGGCHYAPPTGSIQGLLDCAATSSGKAADAEIEYRWYVDGVQQPETGNTYSRSDAELSPGDHTITVVAFDTKNNLRANGSDFKFTVAGPASPATSEPAPSATSEPAAAPTSTFSVALGCASGSCSATVSGAPGGADLQYQWYVDYGLESTLNVKTFSYASKSDGPHAITVVVKDLTSGKSASSNTAVFVGNPSDIKENISLWLTGKPEPSPVDVAKAVGAGAAVTILLGVGQALGSLLNTAGTSDPSSAGSTNSESNAFGQKLADGLEQQALRGELSQLMKRESDTYQVLDNIKSKMQQSPNAVESKFYEKALEDHLNAEAALNAFKMSHPGLS